MNKIKRWLKEKFTKNLGLKILSLVLSFILWVAVINVQDPVETRTFTNVPVTVIHEDAFISKDKLPEITEGDRITVSIKARRSICDAFTVDNIKAVADFEKVSLTDAVPIDVSIEGYTESEVEIIKGYNQVMKLALEDSRTKELRLKVVTSGTPANGYVVGEVVASPNMITVSGSETQINKVAEVVLNVDVNGAQKEMLATAKPQAYDAEGNLLSETKFNFSVEYASVKVPILKTKQIDIHVSYTGKPKALYEVEALSYQPSSVLIAGTDEELAKITGINAVINVNDKDSSFEENLLITDLLGDYYYSIKPVDEEYLAVSVTVKPYESKSLSISIPDVHVVGLKEGYTVKIEKIVPYTVSIEGPKEKLKSVSIADFTPYIDLTGYDKSGPAEIEISFSTLTDLYITGKARAVLKIEEPPTPTPVPEADTPDEDNTGNPAGEKTPEVTGAPIEETDR